ncbi:MAG: hypothetical protein FJX51_03635 [Alphaproteobacteria bacterium]|nr:hypothetical protein [Alphaproteobacteria bacterium]
MAIRLRILAVALPLVAGGCKYWLAGHSADHAVVIHGEGIIDQSEGTSKFTVKLDGRDVVCQGTTAKADNSSGVIGAKAKFEATCNDGRTSTGEVVVTKLDGGTGAGTDDCGNQFQFVWSTVEWWVKDQLESTRKAALQRGSQGRDKCDAADDPPPHLEPFI